MSSSRQRLTISYWRISDLRPDPRNPRIHTRAQVESIAKSIKAFGFNAPILIDKHGNIVVGHGRYEAAKLLGLSEVPIVCLDDLSDAQARAYMLADNQLTDRSTWDEQSLAVHLKELSELALEFSIEATGFELPEIDLRIQSLEDAPQIDAVDDFSLCSGPTVSRQGDLWQCGENRLYSGSALADESYDALMSGEMAAAVFADPPYNVKIVGNVSGLGSVKHHEFVMASGEMSGCEYNDFLTSSFRQCGAHTAKAGIIYGCMDFRHMKEMLKAGEANGFELLNLCVWVKTNGGMGSFYRSQHELIFVFANGEGPHINNVRLGRHGRNRTNVWNYAGANVQPREGGKSLLALHPTVKPVMMVADAIRDSTKRGDIVLDPFIGSGTSILAAQRVGRRCYGIELDPRYIDTAIARWQRMTGGTARHANGKSFTELAAERGSSNE